MKILGNLKNEAKSFLEQYKSQSPAAYAAAQQAVGGLLILDGFTGIDNPLGGKKRPGIFGSLIGILIGVVFVLVPTFFGNISGLNKMTATTSATVVSVSQPQTSTSNFNNNQSTSTSCTAVATYNVNGQTYSHVSADGSSSTCSLTAGQTIQINYNPSNPTQWSSDAKTVGKFLKVFLIIGILAIITGIFTFIIRLLSIIFGWKILKNGRALAKTLPPSTDLSSAIKEIEQSFKTSLFGFQGGLPGLPQTPVSAPQSVITQQPVAPQQVQAQPQPQPTSQPSQASPEQNNQSQSL